MNTFFKYRNNLASEGFTLIEVMLSMSLFISVMVVATIGFVGINRTFSKGLARKNLSEAVQRTVEDISSSIRANGGGLILTVSNNDKNYNSLCSTSACYYWDENGGLYKYKPGDEGADFKTKGNEIVDQRYVVDKLETNSISGDQLWRITGVIRSTERSAFDFADDGDPYKTTCKGTSQDGAAQNCALEIMNSVVSTVSKGSS